jgi:hypothetical protein
MAKDFNLDFMIAGINQAIGNIYSGLETTTQFLDNTFKGLDVAKLPEYQKALEAVEAYKMH